MPDDVRDDFINYKIGDDRPIAWDLAEVDGSDLEASGFRAYAQVRAYAGGTVLHEWSTDNHRARLVNRGDEVGWIVELLVDDSRDWTWSRGLYDLFLVDSEGQAAPIAEGAWVNRPAVTVIPPSAL